MPTLARLRALPTPDPAPAWGYDQIAGRFVEISGAAASAVLTAAFRLVLDAQRRGEPVAWIAPPHGTFFPPDAADGGVDLDTLAVVRVPDVPAMARAADHLARSGGFGLVVLDLAPPPGAGVDARTVRLPDASQTRLVGLAQKHGTAILVLTEKPAELPSLGSLISLRAAARRPPSTPDRIEVRVLKDKRRGPGQLHQEACHGPAGLY